MAQSSIEWTDATWNPVTGCKKVSPGCTHCYAERMAHRLQAMGQKRYKDGFKLTIQEDMLLAPLSWKKPRMIFVNSMSDIFHKDVPLEYIQRVFLVMENAKQHTFQILTKRSERLKEIQRVLRWTKNIWQGVSVENGKYVNRIDDLRTVPSQVRFLSLEPLLGELPNLNLEGIDWVIVGGESGPGARPMQASWVFDIRDQCKAAGVPFFFKQWGGVNKKKAGRLLAGKEYNEMPNELQKGISL